MGEMKDAAQPQVNTPGKSKNQNGSLLSDKSNLTDSVRKRISTRSTSLTGDNQQKECENNEICDTCEKMTKNVKSASTIRARKKKPSQNVLERFRNSRPSSPSPLENINEFDEADEGYLFDDEILGPSVIKKIVSCEKTLLLSLVALRLVNALLIQTQFVPDEYWQSLEVAHSVVFGYGHLTWEWKNGLRGFLYPAIFSLLYKILYIFGLDSRLALIKLPRLVQGVIAAWGDLYLYKLSWLLSDRATAQWTLLCQTVSWFMLYCFTRTVTNSTETVLIIMALYYFPWPSKNQSSKSSVKFLLLAALSIIVRPTAAVIWILLCSWHLQTNKQSIEKLLKQYIMVGCLSLFGSALVDGTFYGKWTLVQYNFLHFNVLSGGGSFYGTHPWHWYLSQGLPAVMGTHLPIFILGALRAKNKVLLFVILWTIFIYSLLSHKEMRFLMPIMPLAFHYCGVYFQSLCKKPRLNKKQILKVHAKKDPVHGSEESLVNSVDGTDSTATDVSDTSMVSTSSNSMCSEMNSAKDYKSSEVKKMCDKPNSSNNAGEQTSNEIIETTPKKRGLSTNEILVEMEKKQRENHSRNLSKAKVLVIMLVFTNIPTAMYFSLIHQRGTIVVTKYLYDASQNRDIDVLFLMPCHSTPYFSYIHRNISMRFLTCEPNLNNKENYTDEADLFYHNSISWLTSEYSITQRPWPSHIVYYSNLQKQLNEFLIQHGYRECTSLFHTHLPEGRIGTHVIVSCR